MAYVYKNLKSLSWCFALLLFIGACCVTTGCNTMRGAGEDIEDAGEGVQDAAD